MMRHPQVGMISSLRTLVCNYPYPSRCRLQQQQHSGTYRWQVTPLQRQHAPPRHSPLLLHPQALRRLLRHHPLLYRWCLLQLPHLQCRSITEELQLCMQEECPELQHWTFVAARHLVSRLPSRTDLRQTARRSVGQQSAPAASSASSTSAASAAASVRSFSAAVAAALVAVAVAASSAATADAESPCTDGVARWDAGRTPRKLGGNDGDGALQG